MKKYIGKEKIRYSINIYRTLFKHNFILPIEYHESFSDIKVGKPKKINIIIGDEKFDAKLSRVGGINKGKVMRVNPGEEFFRFIRSYLKNEFEELKKREKEEEEKDNKNPRVKAVRKPLLDKKFVVIVKDDRKTFELIFDNKDKTAPREADSGKKNTGVYYYEGKSITQEVTRKKRNAKIVKDKKDAVRKKKGKLECEVCGFVFNADYGENIGNNFIECHHKDPVAQSGKKKITVNDLALVCSNCHQMLHTKKPIIYTITELQKEVEKRRAKSIT